MSLTMNETYAHRALVYIASLTSNLSRISVTCTPSAALKFVNGTTTLLERPAIATSLASSIPGFTGRTPVTQALVQQWLSWSDAHVAPKAEDLNPIELQLTNTSYLAGATITVADAIVYYTLNPVLNAFTSAQRAAFPAVFRWLDQLAHESTLPITTAQGAPAPLTLPPRASLSLFAASSASSVAPKSAAPARAEEKSAKAPAPDAPAEEKGRKAPKAESKKDDTATAAAGAGTGKSSKKEAAPKAPEVDPVSLVDLRVGKIVKVWEHPSAERLFCEEIDLGEAVPRKIASGLREHYTLEQMQDRLVIVVCNLKPRPLQGFESNGMVLAATSAEGKVELLQPPATAKIGERVTFAGHPNTPAEPNQMAKKKYFDIVAEKLRVNDSLQATYDGIPFGTSAGPVVVSSVKGATIH